MIENFTSNLIPINMHGFLTKNFFINNKLQREINYANLWEKEIEKKILIKHLSKRKLTNFKNLHFLNQIHSSDVVEVKKLDFDKKISADAMVSSIPGVILCILTADCAPIIFYEKENNVIGMKLELIFLEPLLKKIKKMKFFLRNQKETHFFLIFLNTSKIYFITKI